MGEGWNDCGQNMSEIEGYFSEWDVKVYRSMAADIRHGLVVEVGSFLGKSILSIADLCRTNNTRIVAVDHWKGSVEHQGMDCSRFYERFLENVARANMLGWITPMRMPSIEAAALLDGLNIKADLVFIDASHDYESVMEDIKAWKPIVRKYGTLAGHDYNHSSAGVEKAVRKSFKEFQVSGPMWRVTI